VRVCVSSRRIRRRRCRSVLAPHTPVAPCSSIFCHRFQSNGFSSPYPNANVLGTPRTGCRGNRTRTAIINIYKFFFFLLLLFRPNPHVRFSLFIIISCVCVCVWGGGGCFAPPSKIVIGQFFLRLPNPLCVAKSSPAGMLFTPPRGAKDATSVTTKRVDARPPCLESAKNDRLPPYDEFHNKMRLRRYFRLRRVRRRTRVFFFFLILFLVL